MNNIRLIISDMDGTLLNEKHQLTQYTIDTLKKAQNQGIGLVLASGRSLKDLDIFGNQLELSKNPLSGYITLNGLESFNFNKERIVKRSTLDFEDVLTMNKLSLKFQIPLILFYEGNNYLLNAESIDENLVVDTSDFIVADLNRIKLLKEKLLKIVFCASPNIIDKMLKNIDKQIYKNYEISRVEKEWVEINPKGIHKGTGVLDYLTYHHLRCDQVVIFGNGENDIPMLRLSKNGVAVDNSLDNVKKAVNYICDRNDKDGVAHFIKEEVL